jgi:hypothetical protein
MGFSQISEMTERVQSILRVPFFLCQQCVPEPASQVPLSVVSDICKANVGCGPEDLKQAWFFSRLALHLDQSPFSAAAQHSSNKFDFAFALHENPDDKIPQKSRGNGAQYDNEAVYSPF